MPMTPAKASDPDAPREGQVGQPLNTRREFIKRGACAVGAGVATLIIGPPLADATGVTTRSKDAAPGRSMWDESWKYHSWVYLIDIRKCIGCGACVRACRRENDVPDGYFRTWVERYRVPRPDSDPENSLEPLVDSPNGGMDGFAPKPTSLDITKAFFFPKLCCHCTHTPCVQLCPVGASYRTKDGVILVDEKWCIGCGYCVQACPYGSRYMHPVDHVADKCTWCYHRITHGAKPACVQSCPVGARQFGNRKNPDDPINKRLNTERLHVLQPQLRTKPRCYYFGLSREVR